SSPDLRDSLPLNIIYAGISCISRVQSSGGSPDLEIGGRLIRKGDGIIAVKSTANRDPSAFPDPDTLDVHRKARHHVAFGFGAHQCLGQPLARVELQVVYSTLYRRIPTLALAVPLEQLTFKENAVFYGVRELPVTW
ncbi:cytochrome P450, partial [Nonomuraea dietziae]|uniref:cytochrome P450 n=1 Tax=Nonomuraea dietziae TaxID=65515 RepID=UPI0033C0FEA5